MGPIRHIRGCTKESPAQERIIDRTGNGARLPVWLTLEGVHDAPEDTKVINKISSRDISKA